MAAEKTFSRINAGKSMLFLGRCVAAHNTSGPKALRPAVIESVLLQLFALWMKFEFL